MRDKRATFCAFFPEPMDDIDRGNLLAAGIGRCQMFLGTAYNRREQLHWLASVGIRAIFRLEEPPSDNSLEIYNSYYSAAGRQRIARQVAELQEAVPGLVVEACIAGNEPEIEYSLQRGSPNWGNQPEPTFPQGRVWQHQYAVGELRPLLTGLGITTVAPGWSHKRLTPRDAPEPGRQTWARACGNVYNEGPAGLHAYCINWQGPEDENRLLWHVGIELERIQGEAWINELNIKTHRLDGNDVGRMGAIIQAYDLLAAQPWSDAIKSFCFFVSNGRTDQDWSNMIIRDPAAYAALGRWIGVVE